MPQHSFLGASWAIVSRYCVSATLKATEVWGLGGMKMEWPQKANSGEWIQVWLLPIPWWLSSTLSPLCPLIMVISDPSTSLTMVTHWTWIPNCGQFPQTVNPRINMGEPLWSLQPAEQQSVGGRKAVQFNMTKELVLAQTPEVWPWEVCFRRI